MGLGRTPIHHWKSGATRSDTNFKNRPPSRRPKLGPWWKSSAYFWTVWQRFPPRRRRRFHVWHNISFLFSRVDCFKPIFFADYLKRDWLSAITLRKREEKRNDEKQKNSGDNTKHKKVFYRQRRSHYELLPANIKNNSNISSESISPSSSSKKHLRCLVNFN